MTIFPDTKDWTWVLERPCPECGFDSRAFDVANLPRLLRDNAAQWRVVLARPDVGERPDASTWSPLEYSAHVRDVFRIFAVRLRLLLTEHDPVFENWDQDATAVAEHYGEQDPLAVASELTDAADRLASAFDAVPENAWQRTGHRSDGSPFTVEGLARYLLHDPVHHLHDVRG